MSIKDREIGLFVFRVAEDKTVKRESGKKKRETSLYREILNDRGIAIHNPRNVGCIWFLMYFIIELSKKENGVVLETTTSTREEMKMKDVLKGVTVKILSLIIIIALIAGGGYLAYKHFVGNIFGGVGHETVSSVDVVKEKLEVAAELNTGSYLCTDVITKADSKTFKDWKIPFTEKSFIVQYDGIVKAGIKDLTKGDVSQDEDTIIIKLPDVEITGIEIDNDSFEKLDESNNIFNPITVEDLNDAQKDLKDKMEAQAIEKGILDIARENAETVISGMLSDYDVQIEWK